MVKVLEKIRHAQTPDRFTGEFLETKLGCRGGNYRQFIPFGKKLGLLGTDGAPTEVYKRFRNPATSKGALGEALKIGFREVFERNEHANDLSKEDFKGLVVEITGLESKSRVVALICQTFEAIKKLADFKVPPSTDEGDDSLGSQQKSDAAGEDGSSDQDFDLNLSYTINLVLPKTDDTAVFNAIFRSLRENLLRK